MPEQKPKLDSQKASAGRSLHFTPQRGEEEVLITSSTRKKRGSGSIPTLLGESKKWMFLAEPAANSIQIPIGKRLQLGHVQPPVEELVSPELRRNKTSAEKLIQKSKSKGESSTASPPRPAPELPPGIPAPPIPQGRVSPPGPEHGHLAAGQKPKGMLSTLFSPMFHLLQPVDEEGQLVEGPDTLSSDQQEEGASQRKKQKGSKSPSKTTEKQVTSAQPTDATAGRTQDPPGAAELDKAKSAELQVQPPEEKAADRGDPADAEVKPTTLGKPTVSDGASSTDGESETCLVGRMLSHSAHREAEDSEEGSDCEEVYPTAGVRDLDDAFEFEFDPYAFIKSLPPLEQCAPAWRRFLLPKQTRQCKQKTLVLDLDETLVHSTLDGCISTDFRFEVFFNERTHSVNVRQRPHLADFLQRCADLFEVVIFTASQKLYAEQLLNMLDPTRKLIRHRIFRDSCVFVRGNYLKDLTVLGRDLANTVIVDNSPQAFGFQLANGVPIESWYDDESDKELMRLLPFLESLVDVPDVRPIIANAFNLHKLVADAPTIGVLGI